MGGSGASIVLTALLAAGCSDTVCFQWSIDEGACPPEEQADNYVEVSSCDAPIESFDSVGELEDGACCYEVTKGDEPKDCYED